MQDVDFIGWDVLQKNLDVSYECIVYCCYLCIYSISQACVKILLKKVLYKLWSHTTGGLLKQLNYSENCTVSSLKWRSLDTSGL